MDCVGFPSIGYTIAEYQGILPIQEIMHLPFDSMLKKLRLCRLWSENLEANKKYDLINELIQKVLVTIVCDDLWQFVKTNNFIN